MGIHINKDGKFQSDKYPTCPADKVPLSVNDVTAQDLLWEYAQRRRSVDAEFSADLENRLREVGYKPTLTTANDWMGWPDDKPKRYNACTDPCDMWTGPCACGAWHKDGV